LTDERRKARAGHVRDRQSPQEATTIEQRRERVSAMVLAGVTYRQIAAELDVSPTTVAGDVQVLRDAWRERYTSHYHEHAALELAKLEQVERRLWRQTAEGKLAAMETWIKLSRRRAQLLGLDRPERIEAVVASPTQESRSELPKTLGELLALLPRRAFRFASRDFSGSKRRLRRRLARRQQRSALRRPPCPCVFQLNFC
jgi:transposase